MTSRYEPYPNYMPCGRIGCRNLFQPKGIEALCPKCLERDAKISRKDETDAVVFLRYVTVPQAAQQLGVSASYLYSLMKRGQLWAVAPWPGIMLIETAEVERLKKQRGTAEAVRSRSRRIAAKSLGKKGLSPALYSPPQEPVSGYCVVCRRDRPIGAGTHENAGCAETEADEEDRKNFGPGKLRLECGTCGSTCAPRFGRKRRKK